MNNKKPTMLLIMDGFGLNEETYGNAIAQAKKPALDEIFSKYPMTRLDACGEPVGLPDGQMGNSEVGHLNIGAGRIVNQALQRITLDAKNHTMENNQPLIHAMDHVQETGGTLPFFGLLSDGGVHSHINHLFSVMEMAKARGLTKLAVHGFLDGRDVPPRCAKIYIEQLEEKIQELGCGCIASISGRYYAMDRDKRWDRVQLAYDTITQANGLTARTGAEAVDNAYARDENDEFVKPTAVIPEGGQAVTVGDGDSIIMYNFRPDRAREITRAFLDDDFAGFEREQIKDLTYICFTDYDPTIPHYEVAFHKQHLNNTFGEYLASLGKKQLRLAETEKYAHVTFFFNGGVEPPNPGEDRILVPSPKVATYDLQPEMSAPEVCDNLVKAIREDKYDVIIINFANTDMVGHTGVMAAAIKACETVDTCVGRTVEALKETGSQMFLCADHGNSEQLIDYETGEPFTAHTTNPVPFILINADPKYKLQEGGRLCDIVPTLLELMGLPQPKEMTGHSLLAE